MNFIKYLLLKILGEKKYLFLLASIYQLLFKTGRLGKNYQDVYFLKKIIYPGERVLLTRKNNLTNGIPVIKKVWDEISRL